MNERELGRALLEWDAHATTAGPDPRKMAAYVIARDGRRVRRLAAATILLWLVASAMIIVMFALFAMFIAPKVVFLLQEMNTHQRGTKPAELAHDAELCFQVAVKGIILCVSGSVVLLMMAACFTVWLVFAARRATLRQVNANLAAISEQLKLLRGPTPGAGA